MITVNGVADVRGIGRCLVHGIMGNLIYLVSQDWKSAYCYDCSSGATLYLEGKPTIILPIHYGKVIDGILTVMVSRIGESTPVGVDDSWSKSITSSCFPKALTAIVEVVLNPSKTADDVEKAMVEHTVVKVKRYRSTSAVHFFHDGERCTLEQCLVSYYHDAHESGSFKRRPVRMVN